MRHFVVATALLGLLATPAAAQDQSGFFSQEGVEVRADARVFALFALFNALGYDRETRRGPAPLEAPLFTELRQDLRVELLAKARELDEARRFVEQHPWPLAEYVERTLRLGPPPTFAAPEAADEGETALSALLQDFFKKHGGALLEARRPQLAEAARAWLAVLDRDSGLAREAARLGGDELSLLDDEDEDEAARRLVVVVNPLDAHGALYRGRDASARYLVMGPMADDGVASHALLVEALREMVRPALRRALRGQDAAAVSKALLARGVPAAAATAPDETLANALATLLAARALKRELPAAHSAAIPAPLLKAVQPAVDWYLEQKEPFGILAPALVGRTLGLKVPAGEADKRGT